MDLKTYLQQGRGRGNALAKEIGAHPPDISRWADGTRPIPVHFGAPIETATGGLVTRQEMFPDNWQTIWPELVGQVRPPDADPRQEPDRPRRKPPNVDLMMTLKKDE